MKHQLTVTEDAKQRKKIGSNTVKVVQRLHREPANKNKP